VITINVIRPSHKEAAHGKQAYLSEVYAYGKNCKCKQLVLKTV
jgi:hypothetical protein